MLQQDENLHSLPSEVECAWVGIPRHGKDERGKRTAGGPLRERERLLLVGGSKKEITRSSLLLLLPIHPAAPAFGLVWHWQRGVPRPAETERAESHKTTAFGIVACCCGVRCRLRPPLSLSRGLNGCWARHPSKWWRERESELRLDQVLKV